MQALAVVLGRRAAANCGGANDLGHGPASFNVPAAATFPILSTSDAHIPIVQPTRNCNMTTCVLVADSGAARIYLADKRLTDFDLLEELANPEGRLTRSEMASDRPGVQRNDGGGSHGLGGDRSPHDQASERFARSLCSKMHDLHQAGRIHELKIAAAPHFLGLLRQHLHKDCQAILGKTVNKDLLRADTATLAARLA
jgi:protein required for attachment to host cells